MVTYTGHVSGPLTLQVDLLSAHLNRWTDRQDSVRDGSILLYELGAVGTETSNPEGDGEDIGTRFGEGNGVE